MDIFAFFVSPMLADDDLFVSFNAGFADTCAITEEPRTPISNTNNSSRVNTRALSWDKSLSFASNTNKLFLSSRNIIESRHQSVKTFVAAEGPFVMPGNVYIGNELNWEWEENIPRKTEDVISQDGTVNDCSHRVNFPSSV